MIKYEEVVKVRPIFKKQSVQTHEPLEYMKKIERKNKLQPIDHLRVSSRKVSRTTENTSEYQTELSTALKIEVGRYGFEKRLYAQE